MKASFHEIAGAINQANRIAILSHVRPDCDAIGSQLALALSLQQLGKEVSAWDSRLLMVVYNLDFGCVPFGPHEADPVLIVDPDTVLPFAVALQGFQVIRRRARSESASAP